MLYYKIGQHDLRLFYLLYNEIKYWEIPEAPRYQCIPVEHQQYSHENIEV